MIQTIQCKCWPRRSLQWIDNICISNRSVDFALDDLTAYGNNRIKCSADDIKPMCKLIYLFIYYSYVLRENLRMLEKRLIYIFIQSIHGITQTSWPFLTCLFLTKKFCTTLSRSEKYDDDNKNVFFSRFGFVGVIQFC